MLSEITEEDDDSLGDQIRELKVLLVSLSHFCKVSSIAYFEVSLCILTLRCTLQLFVLVTGRAH